MRKANKKKKGDAAKEIKPEAAAVVQAVEKDAKKFADGRMDFGGLPDRDLKKNLGGCG